MNRRGPIPVAIFGKDAEVAKAVCEKLLPEYDVIHVCLDLPSALAELPLLFPADASVPAPQPASGLGSNASSANGRGVRWPKAVFFGGKFSDDEYRAVVDAVTRAAEDSKNTILKNRKDNAGKDYKEDDDALALAAAPPVRFVKVQKRDVFAAGSLGPPSPAVIARIFRRKMAGPVGDC